MAAAELSEGEGDYEQRRLENIRRNREILDQLRIPELVAENRWAAARSGADDSSRVRGLGSARAAAARRPVKPTEPVRKSRRLEGLGTVVSYNENDQATRRVLTSLSSSGGSASSASADRDAGRSLEPVVLDALNLTDDGVAAPSVDAIDAGRRAAIASFVARAVVPSSAASSAPTSPVTRRSRQVAAAAAPLSTPAPAAAPVVLSAAVLWRRGAWALDDGSDVAKVVKERIYRLAFLPRSDRLVVVAGDKAGHIGLWDVAATEGTPNDPELLLLRPHRNVISAILPLGAATLVTGSYDGTVRLLDLTTLQGRVVAATDDEDAMVTAVESKDGHTLLYSDGRGGVGRCDLRTAASSSSVAAAAVSSGVSYHQLHDRKVSHLDIHPLQHHFVATASVDRTVRLWDWRGSLRTPLAELPHGLAVNAACFSPGTGAALLTTSYDDRVRIFDVAAVAAATNATTATTTTTPQCTLAAPHNNQTGRWVTGFRAAWLPWAGNAAVAVGSMQRQIDVLSATTGQTLAALAADALATIPAVTVAHPTLPVIAGGVASGRCYLFRHHPVHA